MSELGHNPNADYAERMRARATPVKDQVNGAVPVPPAEPIHITREQAIAIAGTYGLLLVDHEGTPSHSVHIAEQVKTLQDQNVLLLERCRLAEASAANAIRELEQLKKELAVTRDSAASAGAPAEETPNA